MGNSNQWLTDNTKTIADIDASFGLYIHKYGGTLVENLTVDGSLIFKGGTKDGSTSYITLDPAGTLTLKTYLIT